MSLWVCGRVVCAALMGLGFVGLVLAVYIFKTWLDSSAMEQQVGLNLRWTKPSCVHACECTHVRACLRMYACKMGFQQVQMYGIPHDAYRVDVCA